MKTVEQIIEEALEMRPGTLKDADDRSSVEEWDSLGHLKVLTQLDIEFDGRIAAIPELADAASVREIKDILRGNGVLGD